ncbi:hypothetical protein DVQ67_21440, partial [Yersinia enterocolitica]|nr:hypothetical protein [Yersinia enterocolitica]
INHPCNKPFVTNLLYLHSYQQVENLFPCEGLASGKMKENNNPPYQSHNQQGTIISPLTRIDHEISSSRFIDSR